MNTTNIQITEEDDDLRCTICNHFYSQINKPYLLPCNHNLCLNCIEGVKEKDMLFCPMCRTPFKKDSKFQVNYSFLSLVLKILKHKNIFCKVCKRVYSFLEHYQDCNQSKFVETNEVLNDIKELSVECVDIMKNFENLMFLQLNNDAKLNNSINSIKDLIINVFNDNIKLVYSFIEKSKLDYLKNIKCSVDMLIDNSKNKSKDFFGNFNNCENSEKFDNDELIKIFMFIYSEMFQFIELCYRLSNNNCENKLEDTQNDVNNFNANNTKFNNSTHVNSVTNNILNNKINESNVIISKTNVNELYEYGEVLFNKINKMLYSDLSSLNSTPNNECYLDNLQNDINNSNNKNILNNNYNIDLKYINSKESINNNVSFNSYIIPRKSFNNNNNNNNNNNKNINNLFSPSPFRNIVTYPNNLEKADCKNKRIDNNKNTYSNYLNRHKSNNINSYYNNNNKNNITSNFKLYSDSKSPTRDFRNFRREYKINSSKLDLTKNNISSINKNRSNSSYFNNYLNIKNYKRNSVDFHKLKLLKYLKNNSINKTLNNKYNTNYNYLSTSKKDDLNNLSNNNNNKPYLPRERYFSLNRKVCYNSNRNNIKNYQSNTYNSNNKSAYNNNVAYLYSNYKINSFNNKTNKFVKNMLSCDKSIKNINEEDSIISSSPVNNNNYKMVNENTHISNSILNLNINNKNEHNKKKNIASKYEINNINLNNNDKLSINNVSDKGNYEDCISEDVKPDKVGIYKISNVNKEINNNINLDTNINNSIAKNSQKLIVKQKFETNLNKNNKIDNNNTNKTNYITKLFYNDIFDYGLDFQNENIELENKTIVKQNSDNNKSNTKSSRRIIIRSNNINKKKQISSDILNNYGSINCKLDKQPKDNITNKLNIKDINNKNIDNKDINNYNINKSKVLINNKSVKDFTFKDFYQSSINKEFNLNKNESLKESLIINKKLEENNVLNNNTVEEDYIIKENNNNNNNNNNSNNECITKNLNNQENKIIFDEDNELNNYSSDQIFLILLNKYNFIKDFITNLKRESQSISASYLNITCQLKRNYNNNEEIFKKEMKKISSNLHPNISINSNINNDDKNENNLKHKIYLTNIIENSKKVWKFSINKFKSEVKEIKNIKFNFSAGVGVNCSDNGKYIFISGGISNGFTNDNYLFNLFGANSSCDNNVNLKKQIYNNTINDDDNNNNNNNNLENNLNITDKSYIPVPNFNKYVDYISNDSNLHDKVKKFDNSNCQVINYTSSDDKYSNMFLIIYWDIDMFELTQMPNKRAFHSHIYYDKKLYLIGGCSNTKTSTTSCIIYNWENKQWELMANLNQERANSSLCIVNNYFLYCFRGYNFKTGQCLDSIEWINIDSNYKNHMLTSDDSYNNHNQWNLFYPKDPGFVWISGCGSSCIKLKDDSVFIIGGCQNIIKDNKHKENYTNSSYIFNPYNQTIVKGPDLYKKACFTSNGTVKDLTNSLIAIDYKNESVKMFGIHSFSLDTKRWKFIS